MFQSLGNHEFDEGVQDVASFIRNTNIPVVASNLDLTDEPLLANERNLMKSKVLMVNGRKIGIIGYLTPETTVSNTQYIIYIIWLLPGHFVKLYIFPHTP